MKVVVDLGLCQGHGRCYDLAPDVFTADDDGYVELVVPDGEVAPEHEAQARAAVNNCPERAISVE
ncbi:MAG: ferredoxin [Acidimicrobiales bacterium]|nr:ferredoxin [Acidimicrobiales bacterium]